VTRPRRAQQPDPLAIIDATQQFAEQLRGAVAVLVADGWSDEHARLLVLQAVLRSAQQR
jgi:hypothetical protein